MTDVSTIDTLIMLLTASYAGMVLGFIFKSYTICSTEICEDGEFTQSWKNVFFIVISFFLYLLKSAYYLCKNKKYLGFVLTSYILITGVFIRCVLEDNYEYRELIPMYSEKYDLTIEFLAKEKT